jgi:putative SOS response-associated peptidase YedK
MLGGMCGRFVAATPPSVLAARFDAMVLEDVGPPRWNVAPTDPVPAVCTDRSGARQLGLLRWGLVPSFSSDARSAAKRINARAETVATAPSFRRAFAGRRCIVPADGFYEWDADRQPWFISRTDGLPLAMAGIWEKWQGIGTCAVITTAPPDDDAVAPLHDRCPVVIDAPDYDAWLDRSVPGDAVAGLLRPPAAGTLVRRPASRRVNNVRNDGPELLDPAAAPAEGPATVHAGRRPRPPRAAGQAGPATPLAPGSTDGPVALRLL